MRVSREGETDRERVVGQALARVEANPLPASKAAYGRLPLQRRFFCALVAQRLVVRPPAKPSREPCMTPRSSSRAAGYRDKGEREEGGSRISIGLVLGANPATAVRGSHDLVGLQRCIECGVFSGSRWKSGECDPCARWRQGPPHALSLQRSEAPRKCSDWVCRRHKPRSAEYRAHAVMPSAENPVAGSPLVEGVAMSLK